MATYIALCSFTDQGIRNVKDSTKRAAMSRSVLNEMGVTTPGWTCYATLS